MLSISWLVFIKNGFKKDQNEAEDEQINPALKLKSNMCQMSTLPVRITVSLPYLIVFHLVSPLVCRGSVNVHRGALLLVPQRQCISSFVFYIRNVSSALVVTS